MLGGQVRFGGWVEFAGLDRPPEASVFEKLDKLASTTLNGLNKDGASQWMGHRPALPDSVPVIGPSRRGSQVLYAFGHGHLGVTQAAITAKCIACLARGENSPIPIDLYSSARF
jgi:D-amino-acid dehydrogenase